MTVLTANRPAGGNHHLREQFPVGINLEVPVGQIVRFVPQHYRFNHSSTLRKTMRTYNVPASSWSRMYLPSFFTCSGRQIHVSISGWDSISRPELRNIASMPPWLGIHQLVGSPAYFFSMK